MWQRYWRLWGFSSSRYIHSNEREPPRVVRIIMVHKAKSDLGLNLTDHALCKLSKGKGNIHDARGGGLWLGHYPS